MLQKSFECPQTPFLLKQRDGAQDYMIAMIFIEKIINVLKPGSWNYYADSL